MAINDTFPIGLKREIATALQPLFGNDFPITQLRNKVYVGFEYPNRDIVYPTILVNFNQANIENVGLGHYDDYIDVSGTTSVARHFRFTGSTNFSILTQSPKDRDLLAAALIQILAMGEITPEFSSFHTEIKDNDYIMLQLMTDVITPGGEQTGSVPWGDPDEIVFACSYSVQAYGEFYSDLYTGDLIQISKVDIWPVREGDPLPW